jgi:hypothetical protein
MTLCLFAIVSFVAGIGLVSLALGIIDRFGHQQDLKTIRSP